MLLIPFDADYTIPLRRAPDVRRPALEAYGPAGEPFVASLRELLGLIGAHEWRRKGVFIPALDERIHPWYGVFSPVRGEYVELVAQAPLPPAPLTAWPSTSAPAPACCRPCWRIAACKRVIATDMDERALGCARANIERLGLDGQVEVVRPTCSRRAAPKLVVCNPPWLPGKPSSAIEYAIYDPDSRMLRGFLAGLKDHLLEGGEGWLILSDLAEHLGLRSREQLLGWIADAGLAVAGRHDIRPTTRRPAIRTTRWRRRACSSSRRCGA
jgi:hypothetical protein